MEETKKSREDLRAATERAVSTILACEQQKLQEIDDIEVVRLKALDYEKDELKRHAEALKTAISLADKLVQTEKRGRKTAGRLLEALDKRTTQLEKTTFPPLPDVIRTSTSRRSVMPT